MKKAKKTLADINEHAQARSLADRMIASAGNQNIPSPLDGIEDVRVHIHGQDLGADLRRSVAIPGTTRNNSLIQSVDYQSSGISSRARGAAARQYMQRG